MDKCEVAVLMTKKQMLCDFTYRRYLQESNSETQKVDWWVLGAGRKQE